MTPARLGEAKTPIDSPLRSRTAAKAGYEKSTGSSMSSRKLSATPSMPPVAKGRAPNRSDRYPETGPAIRIPAVSGSM